jgi:hypothetical protein
MFALEGARDRECDRGATGDTEIARRATALPDLQRKLGSVTSTGEVTMGYTGRVLLFLTTLLTTSCGADLSKTIKEMGHQELRPPTTLTPPGTIIVIRGEAPIEVAVVCTQDEVVKSGNVLRSPTQSVTLAEKTKTSFRLGAEYLGAYGVDMKVSHLEGVSLTLAKAEVQEIPDSALPAALRNLGADCKEAIRVRREHNRTVGLIKSVLKANVVYTLEFDDEVDASGRATILSQLAVKLGGSVDSSRASTIQGEGLYWGILTDTDFRLPGLPGYGYPLPPDLAPPSALPEIDARRLLIADGAPIFRVEPRGTDAADYR